MAALAKEVKGLQGKLRAANTAKAALSAAAAKPAPSNKELVACRQNALSLEEKVRAQRSARYPATRFPCVTRGSVR